jgi:hypothetical protein
MKYNCPATPGYFHSRMYFTMNKQSYTCKTNHYHFSLPFRWDYTNHFHINVSPSLQKTLNLYRISWFTEHKLNTTFTEVGVDVMWIQHGVQVCECSRMVDIYCACYCIRPRNDWCQESADREGRREHDPAHGEGSRTFYRIPVPRATLHSSGLGERLYHQIHGTKITLGEWERQKENLLALKVILNQCPQRCFYNILREKILPGPRFESLTSFPHKHKIEVPTWIKALTWIM